MDEYTKEVKRKYSPDRPVKGMDRKRNGRLDDNNWR
jgi:hypothetical protein